MTPWLKWALWVMALLTIGSLHSGQQTQERINRLVSAQLEAQAKAAAQQAEQVEALTKRLEPLEAKKRPWWRKTTGGIR